NTIVVACIVNIWLYLSADRILPSGPASWARMSSASRPPTRKKNRDTTPYMIPSFLWSTVKTHDFQPVACTGRRRAPYVDDGVTGTSTGGAEGSISAMVRSLPFEQI